MLTALAFAIGTAALLYYIAKLYFRRNADFWTKRGIPFLKNDFSVMDLLTGKITPVDFDEQYYIDLGDKKFGGALELGTPVLYVKDLDLARNIFVKDFDHFFDRRDFAHSDILFSESLFFLEGQKWKDMRAFLSPTFTSGKIRRMFHHFDGSCSNMLNYIRTCKAKGSTEKYDINVPNVMRKLALEIIGKAVFGMDVDIFNDSNSAFYKMAEKLGTVDTERKIRFGIFQSFPKFADLIKLQIVPKDIQGYFQGILSKGLRFRENSSNPSDDFLQILVEAKRGSIKIDQDDLTTAEQEARLNPSDVKKNKMTITENMAVGQGFLFLFAGFETVSNNLSIVLYMLAGYPEMQEKVFAEVEESIQSTNGQINYEVVNRMEYMDMFVSEVMRLHPNVSRIERKCMEDYIIPDTDSKVIPKGTVVIFSAESFHRDEKHFPDPLKFDPERFNAENKAKRNPYSYMPFGIGPRNCIGMRFALIETKAAIAQIVHNFIIEPTETTPMPPTIVKVGFGHKTDNDLQLRFVPRK